MTPNTLKLAIAILVAGYLYHNGIIQIPIKVERKILAILGNFVSGNQGKAQASLNRKVKKQKKKKRIGLKKKVAKKYIRRYSNKDRYRAPSGSVDIPMLKRYAGQEVVVTDLSWDPSQLQYCFNRCNIPFYNPRGQAILVSFYKKRQGEQLAALSSSAVSLTGKVSMNGSAPILLVGNQKIRKTFSAKRIVEDRSPAKEEVIRSEEDEEVIIEDEILEEPNMEPADLEEDNNDLRDSNENVDELGSEYDGDIDSENDFDSDQFLDEDFSNEEEDFEANLDADF